MRKIALDEFVRRLKDASETRDKRFAFFVGAGCSVTSGIPDASTLVSDRWLPRLRDLKSPGADITEWSRAEYPELKTQRASSVYGRVIADLFLDADSRQRELEDLCDGRFPS